MGKEPGNTFTDLFQSTPDPLLYLWAEGWTGGEAQDIHAKTEWFLKWDVFNNEGKFQSLEFKWFFAPSASATVEEVVQAAHEALKDVNMDLKDCDLEGLPGKDDSHLPFLSESG